MTKTGMRNKSQEDNVQVKLDATEGFIREETSVNSSQAHVMASFLK